MEQINQSRFKLSLRIRHPSIDPALITDRLGLTQTNSFRFGERRSTPKGELLEGVNKESLWFLRVPAEHHTCISESTRGLNEILKPHQDFLRTIVEQGGVVEYFIGWFVDANDGDILDWTLLSDCAQLRISISLDVYGEALKREKTEK